MQIEQQKQLREVFQELKNEIDITQKEATKVLRIHHGKFRFHMNAATMDDEVFLKSEDVWNNIDLRLKTLNHIKLILERYRNDSGGFEESEALGEELLNYSNIAKQKGLTNIAKIFTDYRTRLAIVNSDIEEFMKLKIKYDTNSQFIKETFLKACKQLDASIFEPFIDEDQYFEGLDKYRFLDEMKRRFDVLKAEGVKEVELVMGRCEMCFRGAVVYEFYVQPNIGIPVFSYNIQEKNGVIKNIFRCNLSSGYSRDAEENRNPNLKFIKYH
jgi:hypothetical protein